MELYQPKPFKISYDTEKYNFRDIISKILKQDKLESLHDVRHYDVLERAQDQSTVWHKLYYDNFSVFNETYLGFIQNYLKPLFHMDKVVYQKIPTFRVHLVENIGVGEWHRDNAYNHGNDEVNLWMPFTDTYDTNTIWMESEVDLADFKSYDVKYGEILLFSGATLMHGNKINKTKDSRVSVDFRLVAPERFKSSTKESINGITKFNIGGYFEII